MIWGNHKNVPSGTTQTYDPCRWGPKDKGSKKRSRTTDPRTGTRGGSHTDCGGGLVGVPPTGRQSDYQTTILDFPAPGGDLRTSSGAPWVWNLCNSSITVPLTDIGDAFVCPRLSRPVPSLPLETGTLALWIQLVDRHKQCGVFPATDMSSFYWRNRWNVRSSLLLYTSFRRIWHLKCTSITNDDPRVLLTRTVANRDTTRHRSFRAPFVLISTEWHKRVLLNARVSKSTEWWRD